MSGSSSDSSRMIRIPVLVLAAVVVALALALSGCGGEAATDATPGGDVVAGGDAASGDATPGESVTTMEGPMTSVPAEESGGSLVGKWHSEQTGETMEFTADGRLIVTSGGGAVTEMTYTADGSNITYLIGGAVVYTGTYSVDGDVLSQVDPRIVGTVYFDRVE